jgi:hypothetical protein
MVDDMGSPYRRLIEMLPDYACGVIWLLNIVLLTAVTTTKSEAVVASERMAALLKPFQVPEIAVGFLLVITGVMLPYSLARALNPIAVAILNLIRDLGYQNRHDSSVLPHHLAEFEQEVGGRGLPLPKRSFHLTVLPYLAQRGSPMTAFLSDRRRDLLEQAYLAFPVSMLVTLGTYAFSPCKATAGSIVLATFAGLVVLAVTVHRAQKALVRWHAETIFAFLVVATFPKTSNEGAD